MSKNLNCPNCGAVITGSKCEYCGTVFETKNIINLKGDNFKIELNVNGEDILAYISSVQVDYNRIFAGGTNRDITGKLLPDRPIVKRKISLDLIEI